MMASAISRPVRPFAAGTRENFLYVLCTFHCAQKAKMRAGTSSTIVGSKKPNMESQSSLRAWGRSREPSSLGAPRRVREAFRSPRSQRARLDASEGAKLSGQGQARSALGGESIAGPIPWSGASDFTSVKELDGR